MKSIIKKCIFSLIFILQFVCLVSCGEDEIYYNISASDNLYTYGSQEILIENNTYSDEPVKFKNSISKEDIVLEGVIDSKTVTNVKYISQTSISVTISGKARTFEGNESHVYITVKHNGLESKGSSKCLLKVQKVELYTGSYMSSHSIKDGVDKYTIYCTLAFSVGTFNEDAVKYVKLDESVEGDFTATYRDGMIDVTIENCKVNNPKVKIDAKASEYNKNLEIVIGKYSSCYVD